MRKIYPRKCVYCKTKFEPKSANHIACGVECVVAYKRKQSDKAEARKQAENKKVLKEKLKTKSDYEKELQKEVNTIIRLIDQGHDCISSFRPMKKEQQQAGHFYSVGSHPALRFHLHNIYGQSIEQNMYQSGNPLGFMVGLDQYFGSVIKNYVLNLKQDYPVLKLSVEELKNATMKAKSIIKWLKLQDRMFTMEERLILRDRFNQEIGIYL